MRGRTDLARKVQMYLLRMVEEHETDAQIRYWIKQGFLPYHQLFSADEIIASHSSFAIELLIRHRRIHKA